MGEQAKPRAGKKGADERADGKTKKARRAHILTRGAEMAANHKFLESRVTFLFFHWYFSFRAPAGLCLSFYFAFFSTQSLLGDGRVCVCAWIENPDGLPRPPAARRRKKKQGPSCGAFIPKAIARARRRP
jgi:hypothetical protein